MRFYLSGRPWDFLRPPYQCPSGILSQGEWWSIVYGVCTERSKMERVCVAIVAIHPEIHLNVTAILNKNRAPQLHKVREVQFKFNSRRLIAWVWTIPKRRYNRANFKHYPLWCAQTDLPYRGPFVRITTTFSVTLSHASRQGSAACWIDNIDI